MQQIRRIYNSEIRAQIARAEKCQQRDTDTISNLYKLNLLPEIMIKKKEDLEAGILKRQEEIQNLQQKEKDVSEGKLDHVIVSKPAESKKKPKIVIDEKKVSDVPKEKQTKIHNQSNRAIDSEDRRHKNDYDYFYRQVCNIADSLPDYIQQNLKEMPNNKGYIWRGCHFYGELPVKHNELTILFEKHRGNVLKIHEIDSGEYRLYEKIGQNQKKLVCKKARRLIKGAPK